MEAALLVSMPHGGLFVWLLSSKLGSFAITLQCLVLLGKLLAYGCLTIKFFPPFLLGFESTRIHLWLDIIAQFNDHFLAIDEKTN